MNYTDHVLRSTSIAANKVLTAFIALSSLIVHMPAVYAQSNSNNTAPALKPAITPVSSMPKKVAPSTASKLDDKRRMLRSYGQEMELQTKPTPIGPNKVQAIPLLDTPDVPTVPVFPDNAIENTVQITRPTLKALIRSGNRLNPYDLESDIFQEVSLKDVLAYSQNENLDITGSRYGMLAQKYSYFAAASRFLPDINSTIGEQGINANIPIPISAKVQAGNGTGAITASSKTTATIIKTGITTMSSGFTFRVFDGTVWTGTLQQRHNFRASKAGYHKTTNDTLLDVATNYYRLVLNQALLVIRTQAVEISEEQERRNTTLLASGLATNLDVLQSRAQLARDRQNLIDQQKVRRNSAISLAHLLNANMGQDLAPADELLRKVRVISKDLTVPDLIKLALAHRPELKQFDELRQAAKAGVYAASASLQPNATLGGNIYGVGTNLGNLGPAYLINLSVKWNIGGLGFTDINNIRSAKWKERQALVEANKQFQDIVEQVRTAYNDSLSAEEKIYQAIAEISAAQEELRLSRIRLDTGLGINIDVLNAQRDLTQANLNKAQAISDFNIAQAKLLHDIGLISTDNLTSGRLITNINLPLSK